MGMVTLSVVASEGENFGRFDRRAAFVETCVVCVYMNVAADAQPRARGSLHTICEFINAPLGVHAVPHTAQSSNEVKSIRVH